MKDKILQYLRERNEHIERRKISTPGSELLIKENKATIIKITQIIKDEEVSQATRKE